MQADPSDNLNPRNSGSIRSTVFTLDPDAKYLKPKPFTHSVESISRLAHNGLFESVTSKGAPKLVTQDSHVQRGYLDRKSDISTQPSTNGLNERPKSFQSSMKQSLLLTIHKMRGSRSAGSNAWRELNAGLRQPSLENVAAISRTSADPRKSSPTCHTTDLPTNSFTASKIIGNTTWNVSPPINANSLPAKDVLLEKDLSRDASHNHLENFKQTDNEILTNYYGLHIAPISDQLPSHSVHLGQSPTDQQLPLTSETNQLTDVDLLHGDTSVHYQPFLEMPDTVDVPISSEANDDLKSHRDGFKHHTRRQNNSISSSYNTTDNFSPGLAPSTINTDGMSPYHLPQPETPSISEFGDNNLVSQYELQDPESNVIEPDKLPLHRLRLDSSESMHNAAYPGFQGYSLLKAEYESALTLRKLPSNPLTANCEPPFKNQASTDLVHSWNDGSQHRMSLLEELVDDLGYLGELII